MLWQGSHYYREQIARHHSFRSPRSATLARGLSWPENMTSHISVCLIPFDLNEWRRAICLRYWLSCNNKINTPVNFFRHWHGTAVIVRSILNSSINEQRSGAWEWQIYQQSSKFRMIANCSLLCAYTLSRSLYVLSFLCARPGGIKRWCCLTFVCRVHRA